MQVAMNKLCGFDVDEAERFDSQIRIIVHLDKEERMDLTTEDLVKFLESRLVAKKKNKRGKK